jgi:hypothetical protein
MLESYIWCSIALSKYSLCPSFNITQDRSSHWLEYISRICELNQYSEDVCTLSKVRNMCLDNYWISWFKIMFLITMYACLMKSIICAYNLWMQSFAGCRCSGQHAANWMWYERANECYTFVIYSIVHSTLLLYIGHLCKGLQPILCSLHENYIHI